MDYDHDGRMDLAIGLDGDVDATAVKIYHQRDDGNFDDEPGGADRGVCTGRTAPRCATTNVRWRSR